MSQAIPEEPSTIDSLSHVPLLHAPPSPQRAADEGQVPASPDWQGKLMHADPAPQSLLDAHVCVHMPTVTSDAPPAVMPLTA
jgi:hypothetical protein